MFMDSLNAHELDWRKTQVSLSIMLKDIYVTWLKLGQGSKSSSLENEAE